MWAVLGVDDPTDSLARSWPARSCWTGRWSGPRCCSPRSCAGRARGTSACAAPRFWPAVGWAALGILTFYVFAAIYTVVVDPNVEQSVAEDLGADDSSFGLIAAGFMIICVAPFAEEFFFRGFFYGALRTSSRSPWQR